MRMFLAPQRHDDTLAVTKAGGATSAYSAKARCAVKLLVGMRCGWRLG